VSSFLFVVLTVGLTAVTAWYFGTGVTREQVSGRRERSAQPTGGPARPRNR
jgi:hypothetical protein